MTTEEAEAWLNTMSREQQVEILKQFHSVKIGVFERLLGIVTGSEFWVQAAFERAEQLRTIESSYNKLVHGLRETLEDTTWRTRMTRCFNCLGKKEINGHSCCICKGTGVRYL